MTLIARVADAIEQARCPHREGPFGGYDYGHPDDQPVKGGRYVVRDFRDPSSPDWGKWLHQTDDREDHERVFEQMTREHIARAAIAAIREPSTAALAVGIMAASGERRNTLRVWRAMIDAMLEEGS